MADTDYKQLHGHSPFKNGSYSCAWIAFPGTIRQAQGSLKTSKHRAGQACRPALPELGKELQGWLGNLKLSTCSREKTANGCCRAFGIAVDGRPRDEDIGARLHDHWRRFQVDAAIHFQVACGI